MNQIPENKSYQPEIQGLRAVAVLAVMIFHVWPNVLSGGYVGVDVFFVISGYLITGILLRDARKSGRISLTNFYGRRIRRLLPAAALVVVVSCLFFVVLPRVQWGLTAKEALASTLYVQNWWLAHQAVDYLAEDNAPSLFQHYWSLSVEEQYYILWPLVYYFVSRVFGGILRRPERIFIWIITVVGGASLAYSIYLSSHNPGLAYFSTGTRAWELALGSALAVIGDVKMLPLGLRGGIGWLGLAMIAFSCGSFSETTVFPGAAALLPTVGAALVILARDVPRFWAANRILNARPMRYVGDISYSLYLWHWPVQLIYTAIVLPRGTGWHHGVVVICVSAILAHLSKKWIEDPFRYGGWGRWRAMFSPAAILAASIGMVGLVSGSILLYVKGDGDRQTVYKVTPELLDQPYNPREPTIPPVNVARSDNPDVYRMKCHVNQKRSDPDHCVFGPSSARNVVVLVGDSHAAQWLPALQEIFRHRPDWRIVTYTKSACAFNATEVTIGKAGLPYESCSEWNRRVLLELGRLRPQIVVAGASATYRAYGIDDTIASRRAVADGLRVRWKQILDIGSKLVVIRDTPRMNVNIPECMSMIGSTPETCSTPLAQALRPDPIEMAIQSMSGDRRNVTYLDLLDQICGKDVCRPVKGQVLIWRDSHHMTATFARTLSTRLEELMGDLIR